VLVAKRGRPPRSGKQEEIDAPVVREAIVDLHEGKFRSARAAAIAVSSQMPGGVDENFDRIYKKILARKDEPGTESDDGEAIQDGMIQLAIELAGESPEVKVKRLTRLFRIMIENARVVNDVIRNLEREGLPLPSYLEPHLMEIHRYIISK
jgi:hypothetical protein